jgi:4-hydroxyacetophenone monooxygenase
VAESQKTIISDPLADCPNDEVIRGALAQADPNVLRLTLYHLTNDLRLTHMKVDQTPLWAGALFTFTLAEEHHAEVRQMAFDWLKANWGQVDEGAYNDDASIRETMEMFGHGPLSDDQYLMGKEEAAFDPFPRGVQWSKQPSKEILDNTHILIVGAGLSGLSAAIHLEQLGLKYTVIERQAGLGGTWHFNNYPGARVDSTSLIYQYKFEKKYPWSEFFASAGETLNYLQHCAEKYGVAKNIAFNTLVEGGEWDEKNGQWHIQVTGPEGRRKIDANFVISASGLFSTPSLPDIPGIEKYKGKVCHSTNWDPKLSIAGKNVAQIGTGASGAQLMPYLAANSDHLAVYQRTANYVLPMEGYKENITNEMHWLNDNFPLYWHWFSYGMHFLNAQLEGLQEQDPSWQAKGGKVNERNDGLRETALAHIKDVLSGRPDLIEKVTPKYPPLARRPTVDNGWYDALKRDNVELVTDAIDHATETGLVTKDGTLRVCDILVCAAGFAVTKYMAPAEYVGRDGATFEDVWSKDGPRAYLGLTTPGYPNFFLFFGPNSQGRSGSFYSMAESWTRYALKAIVKVVESKAKAIEVTPEAFERYNQRMDAKTKELIWEQFGKGFYYLTSAGRSVVNTPFSGPEIFSMLRNPDFDDYEIR